MRNKDEIKQKKMEAAQALASAMKGGDEQKIQEAFVAFSTITEEGIRAEAAEAMSVENHDTTVLASRGVRMLTSAEIKGYTDLGNSVVAAAQSGAPTNWEVTLPETVIDAVMDDIRRAHPLLDEITFMNTHGAIKMLVNKKGAQTAVWGKITSAIAAELEGAFDAVDTMLLKLSAYMPISKDLVELGPTWMDAYVRATLSEAVALGLEVGIVDGDGKEKPIGMTRDVSDTANVQGGVYPRMTAVKLTSLEAEELGKIVAKLARDPLNKDDKHARPVNGLLLLVNPFDYWEKFMPATTPRATDGTFNHDVLPIPAKMIQTPALEKGVAVIGIAKKYFAALGSPRKANIVYDDSVRFIEDERVYMAKLFGAGFPMDEYAFVLLDVSALKPYALTVKVQQDEVTVNVKQSASETGK